MAPGKDQEAIINSALSAISKLPVPEDLLQHHASWTVHIYKHVFRKSPLLVIRTSQRFITQQKPPAELTGAVRMLTQTFGLRVIVDASPNAVDPSLLEWRRNAFVLNVDPYDREQLWSIPEFQTLFADLDAVGMKSMVWSVFGGRPVMYVQKIRRHSLTAKRDSDGTFTESEKKVFEDKVFRALEDEIMQAIRTVFDDIQGHDQMRKILELLDKQTLAVPREVLISKEIEWPEFGKVLRVVKRDRNDVLIPADPAIGLVIRHNLTRLPTREKLIELTSDGNNEQ